MSSHHPPAHYTYSELSLNGALQVLLLVVSEAAFSNAAPQRAHRLALPRQTFLVLCWQREA